MQPLCTMLSLLCICFVVTTHSGCSQQWRAGSVHHNVSYSVCIIDRSGAPDLSQALQDLTDALTDHGATLMSNAREADWRIIVAVTGKADPLKASTASIAKQGSTLTFSAQTDDALRYLIYTWLKEYFGRAWYFPEEPPVEYPEHRHADLSDVAAMDITLPYLIATQQWGESAQWHYRMGEVRDRRVVTLHNWHRMMPPKELFDLHPDYFALVNAERRPYQLCTSNPDVVALFSQRIIEWFDKNPHETICSLSPEDNYGFCECDRCRALDVQAGSITDRLMVFFNDVARRVTAVKPDKKLAFYAYLNYIEPPLREKPHPALIPVICHMPWIFCHNHAITDAQCEQNARFRRIVQAWCSLSPEVYIREYYAHFYWYGLWPILHSIGPDNTFFREVGIKGVISESHEHWGMAGWVLYGAGRYLAAEDTPWEQMVQTYCRAVFPAAHRWMAQYIILLEQRAASVPCRRLDLALDDDTLHKADALLSRAAEHAHSDREKKYVRLYRDGFEFTRRLIGLCRYRSRGDVGAMIESVHALQQMCIGFENDIDIPSVIKTSLVSMILARFEVRYQKESERIISFFEQRFDDFSGTLGEPYPVRVWQVSPWYEAPAIDPAELRYSPMYAPFIEGRLGGLDAIYPPEQNESVQWETVTYDDAFYSLYEYFPYRADGIRYYRAQVRLDADLNGAILLRSIDGVALSIDGKEVYRDSNNRLEKQSLFDAVPVQLSAGEHRVTVKIESAQALCRDDFCVVLYDSSGTAVAVE